MIHRFDTYDDTIREHHLFNPRVYFDDPDKMAGVALYLMELGYDVTPVSVGIPPNSILSYNILSMQEILTITKYGSVSAGCIGNINDKKDSEGHKNRIIKELNEHCEKYRYITFHEDDEEKTIDLNPISCEDNIELFKCLALYRDDTDYGKLIVNNYKGKNPRISINCQWNNFKDDCDLDWVKENSKMLYTLDEIMEYKDLLI